MDIKKYVKLNEEGEIEFDEKAFQSEFDSAISKAVDKYANGKGKDEIRKKLEEEAKMTADEKLKQEREAFEQYKLQETVKLNQAKAKAKLEGKGFSDAEVNFILSTVGNDEEKAMTTIDTLVEERTKFIASTQQSAIENLQKQQQSKSQGQFGAADDAEPQKPTRRTSEEILSYYEPKQN